MTPQNQKTLSRLYTIAALTTPIFAVLATIHIHMAIGLWIGTTINVFAIQELTQTQQ